MRINTVAAVKQFVAVVALWVLVAAATSAAPLDAGFKKLMMPGPLSTAHSEYEAQCEKCHENFKGAAQANLCLDCHKDVKADMDQQQGYHGRLEDSLQQDCRQCHSDHKGREFQMAAFDRDHFNHTFTDFELTGKHASVACQSCHLPDKTFREAASVCVDCHRNDDIHKQQLGDNCSDCHSPQQWKKTAFDHNTTDFSLQGKHQQVACNSCHADQKFENTPTACVDCHRLNDVHLGAQGDRCDSCHNERSWKNISFDHNRDTDFPLTGSHKQAQCNSCHAQGNFDKKPPQSCIGCHRTDDIHMGTRGEKCESCHTTTRWGKSTFNHDRDTDFALEGAHRTLVCSSCHLPGQAEQKLGQRCIDCHVDDDPHKGGMGEDCGQCHNSRQWLDHIRFNHDLTRFPLMGMHALNSCSDCHADNHYRDTPMGCNYCHQHQDIHRQAMGDACETCHNPNSWDLWLFDHTKQTGFDLQGAHENLACEACHNTPRSEVTENRTSCYRCHKNDDIHLRQFGIDCSQCHSMRSFRDVRMGRP